jgi:hypothetical protein
MTRASERRRAHRAELLAAGLCSKGCGRPRDGKKTRCVECGTKHRADNCPANMAAERLEKTRARIRSHYANNRAQYGYRDSLRRAATAKAIPLRWMRGDTLGDKSRNLEELYRRADAHAEARARGDKAVGLRLADLISPGFADMWADWRETLECCETLLGCKLTLDHMQPVSKLGEHSIENWFPMRHESNTAKGARSMDEWHALHPAVYHAVYIVTKKQLREIERSFGPRWQ